MSTIVSSYPETRIWSARLVLSKLHSRAREPETACCAGVTCTKSLDRTEIPQWIYDSRDGLGLFTRDPIGCEGSKWDLYEYVDGGLLNRIDPSGLEGAQHVMSCCDGANAGCFHASNPGFWPDLYGDYWVPYDPKAVDGQWINFDGTCTESKVCPSEQEGYCKKASCTVSLLGPNCHHQSGNFGIDTWNW